MMLYVTGNQLISQAIVFVVKDLLLTTHALICPTGGFPSLRHNELRDLTAKLLSEVCPNTTIGPVLQPLSGECFTHATTNLKDGARLEVSIQGFWGG